jgi:hypothetical protein
LVHQADSIVFYLEHLRFFIFHTVLEECSPWRPWNYFGLLTDSSFGQPLPTT